MGAWDGVRWALSSVLFAALFLPAKTAPIALPLTRNTTQVHINEIDRGRRRLASGSGLIEGAPIYGDFRELAYFYAEVFVGTPPQRQTVIMDTGSSLMAFPCTGCGHCGHHKNSWFDPSKSSTCQKCSGSGCSYTVSYTEGSSIRGTYYTDKVLIGSEAAASDTSRFDAFAVSFKFGCHSSENKLFYTQLADGIMGLGRDSKSIISTYARANKWDKPMFSICLSLNGGTIVLGGTDPGLHTGDVFWTPLLNHARFYPVRLLSVGVGSTTVATVGFGQTIIDTGTSFTYLPHSIFTSFQNKLSSYCASADRCHGHSKKVQSEGLCWKLNNINDLSTFPSMSLTLSGGGVITVQPEHYLIQMAWDGDAHCVGVYSNGAAGSDTVIGANSLMQHDVIFDLEHQKVGIVPSVCSEDRLTVNDDEEAAPTPTPSLAAPSPSALPTPSHSSAPAASAPPTKPSTSAAAAASASPVPEKSSPSPSPSGDVGALKTSPQPVPSSADDDEGMVQRTDARGQFQPLSASSQYNLGVLIIVVVTAAVAAGLISVFACAPPRATSSAMGPPEGGRDGARPAAAGAAARGRRNAGVLVGSGSDSEADAVGDVEGGVLRQTTDDIQADEAIAEAVRAADQTE